MPSLETIAAYLDATLRTAEVPDYPQALNGIQLQNSSDITHVAAAVDFSSATVTRVIELKAELLLVHHGMFWRGLQRFVEPTYGVLRALIQHDIAVYASHLPLDIHPEWGNAPLLARHMGLDPAGTFAGFQGVDVGVTGTCEIPTAKLLSRADALAREYGGLGAIAAPRLAGDRITRRWGVGTGAGASTASIREAVDRELDTLIVGEGPHHTGVEAADYGITIIYAGHYATETFGVRAATDALARKFGVRSSFIDAPTGL
jgi:dinuclear metal center YbgI/SA1388 family protein